MNFVRLASKAYYLWLAERRLVGTYYANDRKTWRKTDQAQAKAKFEGFGEATGCLGITGNTPMAMWMAVEESVQAVTEAHGERPDWRAVGNNSQVDWDNAVIAMLTLRMES